MNNIIEPTPKYTIGQRVTMISAYIGIVIGRYYNKYAKEWYYKVEYQDPFHRIIHSREEWVFKYEPYISQCCCDTC